jgi:hypothetical protein
MFVALAACTGRERESNVPCGVRQSLYALLNQCSSEVANDLATVVRVP